MHLAVLFGLQVNKTTQPSNIWALSGGLFKPDQVCVLLEVLIWAGCWEVCALRIPWGTYLGRLLRSMRFADSLRYLLGQVVEKYALCVFFEVLTWAGCWEVCAVRTPWGTYLGRLLRSMRSAYSLRYLLGKVVEKYALCVLLEVLTWASCWEVCAVHTPWGTSGRCVWGLSWAALYSAENTAPCTSCSTRTDRHSSAVHCWMKPTSRIKYKYSIHTKTPINKTLVQNIERQAITFGVNTW